MDTLAGLRSRGRGGNLYEEDYAVMESLKQLADRNGVAMLVVTHVRKLSADDPVDTVNATTGVTAAADTVMVMSRERGRREATLYMRGRDVDERELLLSWDPDLASWTLLGDAEEHRHSEARREILDVLQQAEGPLAPKQIAALLGKDPNTVRQLMWNMAHSNLIYSQSGRYTLAPAASPASRQNAAGGGEVSRLVEVSQPGPVSRVSPVSGVSEVSRVSAVSAIDTFPGDQEDADYTNSDNSDNSDNSTNPQNSTAAAPSTADEPPQPQPDPAARLRTTEAWRHGERNER